MSDADDNDNDDNNEESPADAVALFRPKNKSMILPFLDLDDSEESDGLYAEELEDGSFLVHTFQPFDVFIANPNEARAWLKQFGPVLPEVHDDPRGLLFFPDDNEPESTTYDTVVKEVGDDGVWIALAEVADDDDDEYEEDDDEGAMVMPDMQGMPPIGRLGAGPQVIDMDMLQKFAGQLMGNVDDGGAPKAVTSFDVGQMFEQMQRGLMDTLTAEAAKMQQQQGQGAGAPLEPGASEASGGGSGEATGEASGDVIDEEFAPDPPPDPSKKK
jgi:hypothetical protein